MGRALDGRGTVEVAAHRDRVWSALLDPDTLRLLIPGADQIERPDYSRYEARLSFGVGHVRARYHACLKLSDVALPHALDLAGSSHGVLGSGSATAHVELTEIAPSRTVICWTYAGVVSGPVALAGTALLQASAGRFVHRFFANFARHVATCAGAARPLTSG